MWKVILLLPKCCLKRFNRLETANEKWEFCKSKTPNNPHRHNKEKKKTIIKHLKCQKLTFLYSPNSPFDTKSTQNGTVLN